MISFFAAGALVASVFWQAPDTTIAVQDGMRLDLRNQSGEIRVTVWERDAVRITVRRPRGLRIDAERSGSVLRVRRSMARGFEREIDPDTNVDFAITVPACLDLDLSGVDVEVSVVGTAGEVSVETVEGAVLVRGGAGFVSVQSMDEDVRVEDAQGRVHANSTGGNVWIRNVSGEVTAESIDGDIVLDNVDARQITVNTVDGDVTFSGPIHDGGRYRFGTHDGDVTVSVPSGVNASVSVATFDGEFETSFPVVLRGSQRYRFNFTLGDGGAVLAMETFDGDIYLRRQR
jgi:hypothetical protein